MWKLQPVLSPHAWGWAFCCLQLLPSGTFCSTLRILSSALARWGLSSSLSLVHVCATEAQMFIHPLALVWPEASCCGRVSSHCWGVDYSCGRLRASIVLYTSIPYGYWCLSTFADIWTSFKFKVPVQERILKLRGESFGGQGLPSSLPTGVAD